MLLSLLALAAGPALVFVMESCILIDPPAQLPQLPRKRPVIVSTDPPQGRVLGTFPSTFLVNVEIPDPKEDIAWQAFIDYDQAPAGAVDPNAQNVEPGVGDAGVRTLSVELKAPVELTRCHTIEVVVAAGSFVTPHVPSPPGGDIAYWTYSPTGDSACPGYDAGPFADGSFPPSGGN